MADDEQPDFEQEQEKKDNEALTEAIRILTARFDTVQVFVTRHESNDFGTSSYVKGFGHWHARRGHIRDWMIREDERVRDEVRQNDDDEDDES